MKLAITGDVMLGRLVSEHIIENPNISSAYVWGDCLPLLHDADARLTNLECVIAASGEPWNPFTKVFHFRAHPRAVEILKAANVDYVSLANNHTLDYGAQALEECLDLLDTAAIARSGAGRNETEAQEPAILEVRNERLAIISITDNEPSWEARGSEAGVFYVDYDAAGLGERCRSKVENAVKKARGRADILIVSAHVGPNWGPPSRAIQALARELIELGCDVYWGHSNHTPQGVEIYRNRPVFYSTGDFIDDYAVDRFERNDLSFLFVLDWEKTGWNLTLIPTKISHFQVNRAYREESDFVMDRMIRASHDFGTDIRRQNGT
ncbi:MAG: CapA family protein, partial [Candidatus Lindowbacteria bacterium]|nr:CapA family protein [Candidatus Lindowbacteria bacterium]